MTVESIQIFRDGGTREIKTDEGLFFQDFRIGTKWRGSFWTGYPGEKGSKRFASENAMAIKLAESVRIYKQNTMV